jgi:hypothetical protein
MDNKRINELADLAKQESMKICGNNQNGFYPMFIQTYNEKFAELIVKECIQVTDNAVPSDSTLGWLVSRQLKSHFGVE